MGANFEDWANFYFAENSGNMDREIVREDAFNAYKMFAGVNKITMQKFTKSLKAFVALCPYVEEMNPAEMCNAPGHRIVRKVDGAAKDMIYLKKVPAAPAPPEPKQAELFESNTTNEGDQCPF